MSAILVRLFWYFVIIKFHIILGSVNGGSQVQRTRLDQNQLRRSFLANNTKTTGLLIASNDTIPCLEFCLFWAGLVNIQADKSFCDTDEGYLAWLIPEINCLFIQINGGCDWNISSWICDAFEENINILLTHLPLDKMAAISQTIFSDAFSWKQSFVFWFIFHLSSFLRSNWQ